MAPLSIVSGIDDLTLNCFVVASEENSNSKDSALSLQMVIGLIIQKIPEVQSFGFFMLIKDTPMCPLFVVYMFLVCALSPFFALLTLVYLKMQNL